MLTQLTQNKNSEMVVVSHKRIAIMPTKQDTVGLLLDQLNLRVIPQRRYTNTNNYGLKFNRTNYGIGASPGAGKDKSNPTIFPHKATSHKVQE